MLQLRWRTLQRGIRELLLEGGDKNKDVLKTLDKINQALTALDRGDLRNLKKAKKYLEKADKKIAKDAKDKAPISKALKDLTQALAALTQGEPAAGKIAKDVGRTTTVEDLRKELERSLRVVTKFENNERIKALWKQTGFLATLPLIGNRGPSYIEPRVFALTLLETLGITDEKQGDTETAAQTTGTQTPWVKPRSDDLVLNATKAVNGVENPVLQKWLRDALTEAKGERDKLLASIESSFDAMTNRISRLVQALRDHLDRPDRHRRRRSAQRRQLRDGVPALEGPGRQERARRTGRQASRPGHLRCEEDAMIHLPREDGYGTIPRTKNGPALAGYGAVTMRNALASTMTTLPEQLRRSLTWDRGKELSQHAAFKVETGVPVYFVDPQSPWQRGTNENTNGLLRQYFPKGTDLARWTADEIEAVATALNSRPRKTLGWRTPAEALNERIQSLHKPVLRRPVESGLGAVIGMDHGAADGVALLDRHPERVEVKAAVGLWLIDQPTTRRLNASSTTAQ